MSAQPFKTLILDLLQEDHLDEEAFIHERDADERAVIGTPELWSAKDQLVHRIFWNRELVRKITAALQQQEVVGIDEDDDVVNARAFERNKIRPWSEIQAEAEQVHADIVALIESLSEEDLATPGRFAAISEERPLYTNFLGSFYEHNQEHLAQYYLDRRDLARAIQIRERSADRILQAEVPEWVKGWFLSNLACFYVQLKQLEKASALLEKALIFAPDLIEHSKSDPDLAALRG